MRTLVAPQAMARRLQAQANVGLRHLVLWETRVSTRQSNGEYVDTWLAEDAEERCLLMMAVASTSEIAAARGVVAGGTCRVVLGRVLYPGMRGLVRWTLKGIAQQRFVEVTSGTDQTNRLFGLATVVDVDLNQ